MFTEILRTIYDYSVNGKAIDNKFIEHIIAVVVHYNNLHDYVRFLNFSDEKINDKNHDMIRVAEYNLIDRFVNVNINGVNQYLEMYTKYYGKHLNDVEKLFFGSNLIVQILLHELEHASQNKVYNSSKDTTDANLIRIGFSNAYIYKNSTQLIQKLENKGYNSSQIYSYLQEQLQLYKKYYKYNPTERMAQIKSYNMMNEIFEPIYDSVPNICLYNSCCMLENSILGYAQDKNRLVSPTEIYINGMGYQDAWEKFDFYNSDTGIMDNNVLKSIPNSSRFLYGLPVTMSEYQERQKTLKKNKKF